MYSLIIATATLFCLIVNVPSAAAQTSSLICYTAPGWGTKTKPWTTFYDVETSTEFQTIRADFTTTLSGAVPDSTITVHTKNWRTDYHEEYIVRVRHGSLGCRIHMNIWLNPIVGNVHFHGVGDAIRNSRATYDYDNSACGLCNSHRCAKS